MRSPHKITTLIGFLVLSGVGHAQVPEPDPDPDPVSTKPQPHRMPNSLDELFPNKIIDPTACRKIGGFWYNKEDNEGCAVHGKQEGVWVRFHQDGHATWAAVWKKGVLDGKSVRFHEDGRLQEEGKFVAGQRQGPFKGYWETGALRFEENLVDDKRQGPWHVFHPSGHPEVEGAYKDDQLDGGYVEFHRSCFKAKEGKYINGKEDGIWRDWNDEGVLLSEGSYKDGKRVGHWKFFHQPSRALVEEGEYIDDKRQGMWTEYFTTGHRFREAEWKDDQRVGEGPAACAKLQDTEWAVDFAKREEGCRRGMPPWDTPLLTWHGYYEDGAKWWERAHDDAGQLDGLEREWHPTGEPLHEGRWIKGVPTGVHSWIGKGKNEVFGTSTITAGSGEWRAFFHDGRPREAGTWKDGTRSGVWTNWFDNGNKSTEETWQLGQKLGPIKWWFESGQLKVTGEFTGDQRSGVWTAWWTNGHVAWDGPYGPKGERTGEWREYYPEGVPKAVNQMRDDYEEGHAIEYHDNGERSGEGEYVAGKRAGVWKFWWKNGELWRETNFVKGVEQGTGNQECLDAGGEWVNLADMRTTGCQLCQWTAKDPADSEDSDDATGGKPMVVSQTGGPDDGQPQSPVTTPEGQKPEVKDPKAPKEQDPAGKVLNSPEREWIFWHANGNKEQQGRFSNGERSGDWTFWYPDGKKMLEGGFTVGKESGAWSGWYPSGPKKFEGSFADGVEIGAWKVFSEDGKVQTEGSYEAGKKVGRWVYYHATGQVSSAGSFVANEEDGPWIANYPSGKKRSEGAYSNGKRTGTWTWWREDGSVWRSSNYVDGKDTPAPK